MRATSADALKLFGLWNHPPADAARDRELGQSVLIEAGDDYALPNDHAPIRHRDSARAAS
ncbi:MAG: hypothetical protein Q4G36_12200 [Paracoccus sp. (in: a-proteobacteria)]|nr:hypothetical protein [Paracoccus sp. (in: a-proteobacteria)]